MEEQEEVGEVAITVTKRRNVSSRAVWNDEVMNYSLYMTNIRKLHHMKISIAGICKDTQNQTWNQYWNPRVSGQHKGRNTKVYARLNSQNGFTQIEIGL